MAIGIPAKYEEVRYSGKDNDEILEAVMIVIPKLGWQVTEREDYFLTGKTLTGSLSLGERIYIRIKNQKIGIRSECAIPTQLIDFGKNKMMVRLFFEALEKELGTELTKVQK